MSVWPLLNFSEAFASSLAVTSTRRPQGSATVADSERAQANNPVSAAAPESLIESEQLLAAYFGASRVGVCILDTDFRFLAINRTLAEMNGILPEAHLGKSVREVLGDFAELVEPQFNRVLATQQPVLNLEISFMLPNRTEPAHWIEQYIPIKGATGKVTRNRHCGCGDYGTKETRRIAPWRLRELAGGEEAETHNPSRSVESTESVDSHPTPLGGPLIQISPVVSIT